MSKLSDQIIDDTTDYEMLVNIVGLVITPDFTMSLLHAMWFVVGLLICLVSWDYLWVIEIK